MNDTATVIEIFSSIQGEGLYVGCRQIFVRFAGCNLACFYCDTLESWKLAESARVETQAGQRNFAILSNPIAVSALAENINRLLRQPHHSVSLTGGEPLCHWQAISLLVPLLKPKGKIYLETNGVLHQELEHVLPHIDIISMDIKLPGTTGREYWQEHASFLRTAVTAGKETFIKIVVTEATEDAELEQAFTLVSEISADIPVILQPVSPNERCRPVSPERMLVLQCKGLEKLSDVRVIPQTHKIMGQL